MRLRIKNTIKGFGLAIFPALSVKLFSIRSRRMIESQASRLGLDRMAREVSRLTEGKVASGPFTGMKLDYEALPVHSAPKFLGTYERELHDAVERMIALAPRYVLNVGCAEGFYAVGFAIRLPDARVFAADADPKAVSATLRNAEINGVAGRVSLIGIIRSGQFHNYLRADGSLLVMDCEGAEFTLLDPGVDPILLRTNMLVEIYHEYGNPGELATKFSETHYIASVDATSRTIADLPSWLVGRGLLTAADERRGRQSWLVLEPKSPGDIGS